MHILLYPCRLARLLGACVFLVIALSLTQCVRTATLDQGSSFPVVRKVLLKDAIAEQICSSTKFSRLRSRNLLQAALLDYNDLGVPAPKLSRPDHGPIAFSRPRRRRHGPHSPHQSSKRRTAP